MGFLDGRQSPKNSVASAQTTNTFSVANSQRTTTTISISLFLGVSETAGLTKDWASAVDHGHQLIRHI